MNTVNLGGFNKFLLWIGVKVVLKRMLGNAAMKTIKTALQNHQLLKPEPGDAPNETNEEEIT